MFDESPNFNYNENYDAFGSTLMETMLEEVARALDDDHRKCWKVEAHQQFVYDFSGEEGPTFGLICTAPDKMNPTMRRSRTARAIRASQLCVQGHGDQTGARSSNGDRVGRFCSHAGFSVEALEHSREGQLPHSLHHGRRNWGFRKQHWPKCTPALSTIPFKKHCFANPT